MYPKNDSFANCDRDKLNLGSGKNYMPTHWNVDINPDFKPDLVCDMRKLVCQRKIFTEVVMHDCLDHMPLQEARVLLRKVKGWLKPKGALSIHTPNLNHLVEVLYKSVNPQFRHEAIKWLYGTDGVGTTAYDSNIIRWCYNRKSLTDLLEGIGFDVLHTDINCEGFGLSVVAQK